MVQIKLSWIAAIVIVALVVYLFIASGKRENAAITNFDSDLPPTDPVYGIIPPMLAFR